MAKYERLVELMRTTPAEQLQPMLATRITKVQATLNELTAAGALANAVTFGGCDYVGFHTAIAMLPALAMSSQLHDGRQPLPVVKVLYRNAQQIQSVGGSSVTALHASNDAETLEHSTQGEVGERIRAACRNVDIDRGESLLACVSHSPLNAFNALQPTMQDDLNVHRFVFAHRTFGLVRLLGNEFSHSILRQCVRFCADQERKRLDRNYPESPIRAFVPMMLDQYRLSERSLGTKDPGEAAVDELSRIIYQTSREQAAEAAAAALADGIDPEVVGKAISLTSNLYVLRQGDDKLRTHGDSPGVHASDASNAWRNMARFGCF